MSRYNFFFDPVITSHLLAAFAVNMADRCHFGKDKIRAAVSAAGPPTRQSAATSWSRSSSCRRVNSSISATTRPMRQGEVDGRQAYAVDGAGWSPWCDVLWDRVFSPDGTRLLIRAIDNGIYVRQVVPFDVTFSE